jgi:hypothetical protein
LTLLILTRFTKISEKIRSNQITGFKARICALMMSCFFIMLSGCIELANLPPPSTTPDLPAPLPTPVVGEPVSTYPWTDANGVMSGICFEAALDAVGQTFVLRNAVDHIGFYDLADNSQLCRRPVARYPFDFSNGHILAGLWSYGRGCTARHDMLSANRDDLAQTITIRLRFVPEGMCNYELVRPFWIALENAGNYTIEILVE